jgi:hypothetical protein
MLARDALAGVSVVEPELVAAVVADRHRHGPQVDDLDLVRMAAVGMVRVVAPMDGGQRGPNDRVGTVRCHTSLSAHHPGSLEPGCIQIRTPAGYLVTSSPDQGDP